MAQRVGRGIVLLFHDRGTRRISSTHRPQFTPGKDDGLVPWPVWTGGKFRPHRYSTPNRPVRSSVTIQTELPGPYTGCNRRNGPEFGRVFLMLNYTDITQNTYIQSRTVTEIIAREKCGLHRSRRNVRLRDVILVQCACPTTRHCNAVTFMCALQRTVALKSQDNSSAAACVKYLQV